MGEYFRIVRTDDKRLYSAGETPYFSVKVYSTDGSLVSPSGGVTLYIYTPCGDLKESNSMTEDSTGVYSLMINALDSTTKSGVYRVKFDAVESSIKSSLDSFIIVLPDGANLALHTRMLSGILTKKQIDDEELALTIAFAWNEAMRDSYIEIWEKPLSNPTTGSYVDDSNTLFQVSSPPIADVTGDKTVKGYGTTSCATDIDGYFIDYDGNYNNVKITVVSDIYGTIHITQTDGTALPSDLRKLIVHYWSRSEDFDWQLFYEAVEYLAAYRLLIRLQSLESTTLADVNSNGWRLNNQAKKMLEEYKRIIRKIRVPVMGGI